MTGAFPEKIKAAKVIPLYKTVKKYVHKACIRPVSLLPQFSKIFKKLFHDKLDTFFEKHNVSSESQYVFRSNRPTSFALLKLIEEITSAVEKSYCGGACRFKKPLLL